MKNKIEEKDINDVDSKTIEYQVSRNIFVTRKLKGLTQEQLSRKIGISNDYISLLERNKRRLSIKLLYIIAKGLNVDVNTLLKYQDYNREKIEELKNNPKILKIQFVADILKKMEVDKINTIHKITQKLYNLTHIA